MADMMREDPTKKGHHSSGKPEHTDYYKREWLPQTNECVAAATDATNEEEEGYDRVGLGAAAASRTPSVGSSFIKKSKEGQKDNSTTSALFQQEKQYLAYPAQQEIDDADLKTRSKAIVRLLKLSFFSSKHLLKDDGGNDNMSNAATSSADANAATSSADAYPSHQNQSQQGEENVAAPMPIPMPTPVSRSRPGSRTSEPGAVNVIPSFFSEDLEATQTVQQQNHNGESSANDGSELMLVQAEKVDQEIHERLSELQSTIDNAPRAEIVAVEDSRAPEEEDADDKNPNNANRRSKLALGGIFLIFVVIAAVVTIIALVATRSSNSAVEESTSSSTTTSPQQTSPTTTTDASTGALPPTLEIIQNRGTLKCKGEDEEEDAGQGFSIDMCRAVAAALLHDPNKVEFVHMPFGEQFQALANGTVDLGTAYTIGTAERDVHIGVAFSRPYLYTGTVFAGVPEYVDCADRNDVYTDHCRYVRVCSTQNSVQESHLREVLDGAQTVSVADLGDSFKALATGICNVVFTSALLANQELLRAANYTGPFKMSDKLYSNAPVSLTTRDGDHEFADIVDWIVLATVQAEAMNITKATAKDFPTTNLFGPEYAEMFQRALAVTGNHAEIYQNHFEERIPQQPINSLSKMDDGLLYATPLGRVDPDVDWGDASLKALKPEARGYLRCGVQTGRPGLAEWNQTLGTYRGMDVDQCIGLAAALFARDTSKLELVEYASTEDAFVGLANDDIDVLAGAEYSMANDVMEPTTGQGFSFGFIYHYEKSGNDLVPLSLATTQDDNYWSDFVQFMSNGPVYAEDEGITQATATQMPVVEFFGQQYRQILRDMVFSVGNSAEQYLRNMEQYIPRETAPYNTLNVGGPMLYAGYKF